MAPEILNKKVDTTADVNVLKQVDIWAFGTVVFHLLIPNVLHPYEIEIKDAKSPINILKQRVLSGHLPLQHDKYANTRQSH